MEASTSTKMDVADGVPPTNTTPNPSGVFPLAKVTYNHRKTSVSVPRFLVVKRKDELDFNKISPFVVHRLVYALVGETNSVKKIKGGLLIECKSDKQANTLLAAQKMGDYEVTVAPHVSLNVVKGVVTCRDLQNCTLQEIVQELGPQGVVEARRITTRRDGVVADTASIILTFERPSLPNKVKAAMYSLPVRPYIPNPLRCYKCQLFGHTASRCTRDPLCACGRKPHEGSSCENPPKCANCNGEHSARYRKCPKYIEEAAIAVYKTEKRCSYFEARDAVRRTLPASMPQPYAAVAAKPAAPLMSGKDIVALLLPELRKVVEEVVVSSMAGPSTATPNSSRQKPNPPAYKPNIHLKQAKPSNISKSVTSSVPGNASPNKSQAAAVSGQFKEPAALPRPGTQGSKSEKSASDTEQASQSANGSEESESGSMDATPGSNPKKRRRKRRPGWQRGKARKTSV